MNVDMKQLWGSLTPEQKREINKLLKLRTYPDIMKDAFPLQRRFIEDPVRMKTLFCTRRAAKTYTAGLYLIKTALEKRNTSSIYIGLTRDQSKRLVWNDVLKDIIKKYSLQVKYNETELTITFENGSIIYIVGVDDSESERDKLLGKKYALAVIDEAASYSIDLQELVYKVLKPAMADLGGTIVMCGTPDNRKEGIFFDLTKDVPVSPPQMRDIAGWRVFSWSTFDNPFMKEQWATTIRDLKAADPFVEEQPWWKQHYEGKWVIESTNKMYRYDPTRNDWSGELPDYGFKNWNYVLGIDLGFNDATALVLMAYHEHDQYTYIIQSEKWRQLTISDTADKIRDWMALYPINYFIVDGANKQAVEEIVRHHQLPLTPAQKTDKASFIRIMNSDFISGKIKVDPSKNIVLAQEYDKAVWNKKALERGLYKEDLSFHGDCTDAALYAYRFTYAYTHTPDTTAHMTDLEREMKELSQRFNQEREDREFMLDGSDHLFSEY